VVERQTYSPASDAFAFGVTMWETLTKGRVPHAQFSNKVCLLVCLFACLLNFSVHFQKKELLDQLMKGKAPKLDQTAELTGDEYNIICKLTEASVSERATIAAIVSDLEFLTNHLNMTSKSFASSSPSFLSHVFCVSS
jgi:hypothetical protein